MKKLLAIVLAMLMVLSAVSFAGAEKANEELCRMAREKTVDTLNKVLYDASVHMKNGYNRADN